MFNALKKKFSTTKVAQPAKAEQTKEPSEMTKTSQTPSAAPELAAQLASALEALSSQSEALAAVTSKFTELQAQFDVAQSALTAVEDAKAALVAEAKATRLAARKEAIVASVGTEKSEALLSATDSLDDISFKAVVDAMSTNLSNEANSELFQEVGVSAVADVPVVAAVEESAEAKLLKAKYKTKANKGIK